MGGREAVRGFEYQFLQALEFSLDSISIDDRRTTTLFVEEPPKDDPNADAEIVDFSLHSDQKCLLAVQVKSGSEASTISAWEAVKIIIRLVSLESEAYLLLTNRAAGPGLEALQRLLSNPPADPPSLRAEIRRLVARAKTASEILPPAESTAWERITRCSIRLDDRNRYEVRSAVREKVRNLRRRFSGAESVGWDAAGILLGYLVSEVIGKAAAPGEPRIPFTALKRELCIDAVTLADAIGRQGWTEYVTVPARQPDIARPEILEKIGSALQTPIKNMHVPVCVLSGLSGIGKTSLAAAWVADRNDSYAAVLWVDASSTEAMHHSFSVIDQWCQAEIPSAKFQNDLKQRVHLALAQLRQPWLLVFDNAIEHPHVRAWLPTSGLGHVLVTTTDQTAWSGPRVSKVAVPPMTQDQALNLMSTRLVGRKRTNEPEDQLREFVEYLQRWPLALELAAAYLSECYGDVDSIGDYKRALMRALDDESSVPLGYPRTLAAAIRLGWDRMRAHGDNETAAECAFKALWFAAYMSSRQIPVHLLLMCIFLDPRSALEQGLNGPVPYRGQNAPMGEIVRAMRKESLVAVDRPLDFERSKQGPTSLNYTISMNEVVQEVIRSEARRSRIEESIVTQGAFFTQSWLAGLIDAGRYDLAGQFLEQCITLGDYGDAQGFDNHCLALLWGNTASALMFYEDWHNAERCLRSELRYLHAASERDPLIDLQTHSQLAYCLLRRAERPKLIVGEVTELLEAVLARADAARKHDIEAVSVQISNAVTVANEMYMDWGRDERVGNLLERLRHYNYSLPSTGLSKVQNEIIKINEMLRSPSDETAAASKFIEALLDRGDAGPHTVTLLRLLAEAKAQSHDWVGCIKVLDSFSAAAAGLSIAYLDLTNLVLGTAYFAVMYEVAGEPDACIALERALTLALQYQNAGGRFRPHDRARLLTYQAFLALTKGHFSVALRHIELVEERDLSEAQTGKAIGPLQLYRVIRQSLQTCDPNLLDVNT